MLSRLVAELGDSFAFVWSGQHYSDNLKDVFFRQLGVAKPAYELGITGNSDAEFVGKWVAGLGELLVELDPAGVAFLGDTNTVLGTLACASLNVPIAHVEGCMRSYDWRMPEEKYRTVADHLSDVIYAYLDEYKEQGVLEGLDPRRILVTGNPIVDVLEHFFLSGRIRLGSMERRVLFDALGVSDTRFAVMTAHRRENVESEHSLSRILRLAGAAKVKVVFPASYRTQRAILRMKLTVPENVTVIDPIGYAELLELIYESEFVLTDSGTVVEETAVLQVPSVQMRTSTERPQVYDSGSSIKFDPHRPDDLGELEGVIAAAHSRKGTTWVHGLGDGKASERIVSDLLLRTLNPDLFRGHDPVGTNRPYGRNAGLGLSRLADWRS